MALTIALELLAEPQRARLLRVLEREELTVGDLARVVALPQSTVSRHLKALAVAGWIHRRAAGTTALVRMAVEQLSAEALELWRLVRDDPDQASEREADRGRLALVLAERASDARTFFGRVASGWDALRDQLFGRGFIVPTVLALLPPEVAIADLGSGTGELALRLAPFATTIVGVDREPSMVATARQRLAGHDHVRFVEGPLEALPLPDASVDLALVVLVLHHVPEPARALAEAARILRPGGRLVVVDMQPHANDSWRAFGHVHRGFSERDLDDFVGGTGLVRDRLVALPVDADAQGPPLFVASFRGVVTQNAPALAKARRAR